MPDQIYKVSWNGEEKLNFVYDPLGRLTSKTILVGGGDPDTPKLSTKYTYYDTGDNHTTTLVQSLQTPVGTYNYTYDAVGNITGTTFGEDSVTYEYDALNQLTRENNSERGWTITYEYQNGNITEMRMYEYTAGSLDGMAYEGLHWSYTDSTWGDLLTDFTGISGVNGGAEIQTASAYASARLAEAAHQSGDGVVIEKNGECFVLCRLLQPFNLEGQKVTKVEDSEATTYTLAFMYDNNGDAFGFICNGETYYYVKNAQNDVILITDANGQALVLYQYDAWGKITQCFDGTEDGIGLVNPLFYRSYYLDLEMEMYYLNSRYYLPLFHRFLNADGFTQTGQGLLDKNLFAYCGNNPVNMADD